MVGEIRAKHRIPKNLVRSVVIVIAICAIVLGITDILHPTNSALNEINHFPQATLISVAQQMVSQGPSSNLYPLTHSENISPIFNGSKLQVIGAFETSCQFCARTSPALAIALAQFGSFSNLYEGYSIGDGNYPDLFFSDKVIGSFTTTSTYSSKYIDFIISDYYQPNGFVSPSVQQTELALPQTSVLFNLANISGSYGTPLFIIGNKLVNGAPTSYVPSSPSQQQYFKTIGSTDNLNTQFTPVQMINDLYNNEGTYANIEIQAADMYIATICNSLKGQNVSNTICSNPVFGQLYNLVG